MMTELPRVRLAPISPRELGGLAHLLYQWPIRQAPRLALPLCILLAAVLQGVMIFLFSISYEVPSSPRLDSPQVYFLPPDSKAALLLAPWLEANDPAVFLPQRAARTALPSPPPLGYRPSYMEPPPPLRALPSETPSPVHPPLLPEQGGVSGRTEAMGALGGKTFPIPEKSLANIQPSTTSPRETVVRWEDDLSGRVKLMGASNTPPSSENMSAEASLYQVAVNEDGIPMHNVLIGTCGDAASDEAGRIWIQQVRFQPSDRTTWGRVIIRWGSHAKPTVSTKSSP